VATARSDENPFVGGDPASGVDASVLDRWEPFLQRMDDAGIVPFFFLYDDGAKPFGCSVPLSADETAFIDALVSRFAHHRHLIWMTQEEFDKGGGCPGVARQRALAAAIRAADPGARDRRHHMNGQGMQFGGDPNVDLYGQQAGGVNGWVGVDAMHDRAGKAGWGNWIYVMAEAHPWHKDLARRRQCNRTTLRQSSWASALAGGYVLLYDAFETHDPTDEMLADLRRLAAVHGVDRARRVEPRRRARVRRHEMGAREPGQASLRALLQRRAGRARRQRSARGHVPAGLARSGGRRRVEETKTVGDGDTAFAVPPESERKPRCTCGRERAARGGRALAL
jgi:hypothetical protein